MALQVTAFAQSQVVHGSFSAVNLKDLWIALNAVDKIESTESEVTPVVKIGSSESEVTPVEKWGNNGRVFCLQSYHPWLGLWLG